MFEMNLNRVPFCTFSATPQSPDEEFRQLCDLLVNNRPVDVSSTGKPIIPAANAQPAKPAAPGSSLNNTPNIRNTSTTSSRFAGNGLPFAPPQKVDAPLENVVYTADNLIRIQPNGTRTGLSPSDHPQSSLNDTPNIRNTSTTANRFAAPWYRSKAQLINNVTGKPLGLTGEQLCNAEVHLMMDRFPQAQLGTMQSTGELYWILPVDIDTGRSKKHWVFMLKYDNNHPHADNFGGSVKAIPMIPGLTELDKRAKDAGRTKQSNVSKLQYVPHVWSAPNSPQLYLCTISKTAQEKMMETGEVQSAAAVAGRAIRWALYYEAGVEPDGKAVWDEFCKG